MTLIRAIHARTKGAYGSPRVYGELKDVGHPLGKRSIKRLMRERDLISRHKLRFKATTDRKHSLPISPNVLDRKFTPSVPNTAWVVDVTYISTAEGWLYLAVEIELYQRAVVGCSIRPSMAADIVIDALTMAWFRRRPPTGLLHHSDRGSQYASQAFQDKLNEYGMKCSMSRKGNCWDNAVAESFFNILKDERVHGWRYATRGEARADVCDYVKTFYNQSRRHSALLGKTPASAFEAAVLKEHGKMTT